MPTPHAPVVVLVAADLSNGADPGLADGTHAPVPWGPVPVVWSWPCVYTARRCARGAGFVKRPWVTIAITISELDWRRWRRC